MPGSGLHGGGEDIEPVKRPEAELQGLGLPLETSARRSLVPSTVGFSPHLIEWITERAHPGGATVFPASKWEANLRQSARAGGCQS